MANQFFTYIYRDPTRNLEPFYVGKGLKYRIKSKKNKKVEERRTYLKNNGFELNIEIIPALDESHSFFLEECLIKIYGRRDLGTGTLWNFTNGGEGISGYKHTNSAKEKIQKRHAGSKRSIETSRNISNSLVGKKKPPITENHRKNLSTSAKNMSAEHRKKLSLSKIGNQNARKYPSKEDKHGK